ncbi:hypothetical protein KY306_00450 [Candidatus Woesearchaeota archaeon]|nr:hypothetical protein [Candidatus Woesearchaeota archaeon]
MKYEPSRRNLIFRDAPAFLASLSPTVRLLSAGLVAAGTGALTSGCDEENDSQPAPQRYAALLENYPAFLKNENGVLDYTLVVGNDRADYEAGFDIGMGIQRVLGQPIDTKLPEETDLSKRLILVGRPAYLTYGGGDNSLLTELVNTDPDAVPQLFFDEGLIKVYRHNDMNLLIVTGYGPDQVRNAGKVLSQADAYQALENTEFFGKELLVKGTLDNFVLGKRQDQPTDQ